MQEVVLVTGGETLTGRKLIEKLLSRGVRVVTPVAGRDSGVPETSTENLTVLGWNPSSWFSTKAIIRETLRLHGTLDAAFIVHHHLPLGQKLNETDSSAVETVMDQSVKGVVVLVRELVVWALNSRSTNLFLGMVLPHLAGGKPEPLDAMADGAFKGLAVSVVEKNLPYLWSCGFFNNSPDAEGFAEALVARWQSRPEKLRGHWYRHSEGRWPLGGPGIISKIQ